MLHNDGPNVMAEGLKYVHNDTCVPAQLVIGQFMDALHSGEYDLHNGQRKQIDLPVVLQIHFQLLHKGLFI